MVLEYCLQGLLEPNIERLKQLYRPRLQATLDALEEHLPTARWTQPEGGFFVGVTLPEGSDIETVLGRAPGVGLELTDGRAFYSDRQDGNRFLRIPFCGVRPEEIREGIERLASIV
jgi:2-aminoadipate transaminase